jgi:exodeoxyribonuclease-5
MNWSSQQETALRDIKTWLKQKDQQVFRLFGYAGTGKTTLTKEVAHMVKGQTCFGAFTGKASSVMRRKGCEGAQTIHSMIYTLREGEDDTPEFILNRNSVVREAGLVVIDECSMVDEAIGKDLLSFGKKILVIGDPAQLPPVRGAGFFMMDEPDYLLTEVHRQAAENPIIGLSMKIRAGEKIALGQYGDTRVIARKDANADLVLQADQVIVGLNKTRHTYNRRMRELLGRIPDRPERGDKLICLRNNRKVGVFNGTMWTAGEISDANDRWALEVSSLDEADQPSVHVEVLKEFFNGTEADLDWKKKRGTQEFTYGYAVTCHKSQGSQWNNVVVFDESHAFRDDRQKWLYTAITRCSERLILVK